MTAPTFFAPLWLSADIVLIETIAREGGGGRRDTPFVRHEKPSIRSHALLKTGVICARSHLHSGKPRSPRGRQASRGGLSMRKYDEFAVWEFRSLKVPRSEERRVGKE